MSTAAEHSYGEFNSNPCRDSPPIEFCMCSDPWFCPLLHRDLRSYFLSKFHRDFWTSLNNALWPPALWMIYYATHSLFRTWIKLNTRISDATFKIHVQSWHMIGPLNLHSCQRCGWPWPSPLTSCTCMKTLEDGIRSGRTGSGGHSRKRNYFHEVYACIRTVVLHFVPTHIKYDYLSLIIVAWPHRDLSGI